MPCGAPLRTTGSSLDNPILAARLEAVELGGYRLDTATLNFLEAQINALRPSVVLEFGSGVSTVCLAQFVTHVHPTFDGPRVISVEQDADYAAQTEALLEAAGLAGRAEVILAPVAPQIIEGRHTLCYALDPSRLGNALGSSRVGFVFIDGPSAVSGGSRFGTLPLVRHVLADGARFFVHDALRDAELEVAELWAKLPWIQLDGVYALGKGLLAGHVRSS